MTNSKAITKLIATLGLSALALSARSTPARAQAGGALAVESCPETSIPTDFSGQKLDLLTELKDGVVFDDSGAVSLLRLKKEGGVFRSVPLGIADKTVFAAVADFDGDGWDDFVGAGEGTQFVRIYRNFSFQNLPINWNDPNAILTPKFQNVNTLYPAYGNQRWHVLAAGDFNGDGREDVFWANAYAFNRPYDAWVWLNNGNNSSGNPVFKSRYSAMASGTSPSYLGKQNWGGTNVKVADVNGDRKLDLLVGSGETYGGAVRIFLNTCTLKSPLPNPVPAAPAPLPCANDPRFAYAGYLARDMNFGSGYRGVLPVFAFDDFDGDGNKDLIAGAPSSRYLRVWKGVVGGGVESSPSQSISWVGAATTVIAADFSLDGKLDLHVSADNWNYNYGNIGGISDYFKNNGTSAPFSGGRTQRITSKNNPTYDFDVGFAFNYDNDPDNTPDIMIADGNHTGNFYVFANRTIQQYVNCGEVYSGILDLGTLQDKEMVVTAARLVPTVTLNGGTVDFFMSNENPPNWQPATDCGGGAVCTTFNKPVGREVRWKAVLCSNSFKTQSPQLTNLDMTFDYAPAIEHYRAGVVVSDGVAYVGAFRQPGERGHFYAFNAGLDTTYWDAALKIDAMSDGSRRIWTSTSNGTTPLLFETSQAGSTALQSVLQTASTNQTRSLINWVRSPRFGIGNSGIAKSRLGAIETSTPAIIPKPGLPLWYTHASPAEKTKVDDYIAANNTRPTFAMFGSKDGMIHAIYNNPANIADPVNGTEAWAFIPPKVASKLLTDYSNSLGSSNNISAFPDGSPTVADVKLADGKYHTVAIVGGGNGSKSFMGLEIGDSVAAGGTVNGPDPLWTKTPGGSNAGQAFVKAAVARVRVGGADIFLGVVGTGVAFDDTTAPYTKGRVLHAYDIATGRRLWKFKTKCPVTSDILAFETDDELEPNNPTIDGYIDRMVFSDACGYVYKVDPAKDLAGGWNRNDGLGSISAVTVGGAPLYALFSTRQSAGALGNDAPIAGTIAARPDSSTRMVLFFGTGGVESYAANVRNDFYAIYADNAEIRSKQLGTCSSGRCEKFYGGAVVTAEQIIFTSTVDPAVGTGTCDPGSSTVHGMRLNPDAAGDFVNDFATPVNSAVMGAIYGDAGALYFATLAGDVVRVGTPRASQAGGDTAQGGGGGISNGGAGQGTVLANQAMSIMGWRQVF